MQVPIFRKNAMQDQIFGLCLNIRLLGQKILTALGIVLERGMRFEKMRGTDRYRYWFHKFFCLRWLGLSCKHGRISNGVAEAAKIIIGLSVWISIMKREISKEVLKRCKKFNIIDEKGHHYESTQWYQWYIANIIL